MKKQNMFDIVIVFIQVVLSAFLLFMTYKLLPMKYFLGILAILLLLTGTVIYFLFFKGKMKWVCRIVSIILSLCLIFINITAFKGLDTLKIITGSNEEINTYSIIVLDNSDYHYIEDLNEKDVGICSFTNKDQYKEVIHNINITSKINEVDYRSVNDMVDGLYEGNVEAIILNEAYREVIKDVHENFDSETRIITTHDITSYINLDSHNVDVTKEGFNIFISGIDTYGPVATVSRSDVNMIVTVNPMTKTILLTSIPRDYYVNLAANGAKDKLTHAGLYGVNESIKTLENLFGIKIHYYARVNFTSLVTMVDALGGITVYNVEAFKMGKYDFPIGPINLNGESALLFSRQRYQLEGGDRSRVLNQQRVLQGMLEKAMTPAIITNYSNVLNAINGCFETNMESEDIQKLIQMQLNDMKSWHFKTQSVNGTGLMSTTCYSMPGPSLYVMEPDMNTVQQCTKAINNISGRNGQ